MNPTDNNDIGNLRRSDIAAPGLKKQINNVIVWTIGAPILGIWGLCSALPIFSLLMPEYTIVQKIVEVLFLGVSFIGLFGLFLAARFAAVDTTARLMVDGAIRGKGKLVIGYAALWLIVYGHYQWLFV
ncbi:MAG: hypothetical protein AAF720_02230 [Pseudomonadota bacterium]